MIESEHEISRLPMHAIKIVFFLSAMRHFRDELAEKGYTAHYHIISEKPSSEKETLGDILS